MELLNWLESGALATWVRESLSLWAFPTVIALHALGMAVLVGLSVAICLLILGVAPTFPISNVATFFKFMWIALGINILSGVLLTMANATYLLILPIFYVKMLFVVLSVFILVKLKHRLIVATDIIGDSLKQRELRRLSVILLVAWAIALVAGRLTAYPMLLSGN